MTHSPVALRWFTMELSDRVFAANRDWDPGYL